MKIDEEKVRKFSMENLNALKRISKKMVQLTVDAFSHKLKCTKNRDKLIHFDYCRH